MKKLIITADDFGVYPCINNGVIEAVKAGKVNSVAVLTNYTDSVKNVNDLLDAADNSNREVDIGCHLTITSGRPLTDRVPFLCDASGYFRSYTEFQNNIDTPSKRQALVEELNAQIDVLENNDVKVKHLTCHHNSLTLFPRHFDIYLEVAHKRGVPMRSPNTIPEDKQQNYLRYLRFKLIDDVTRADRQEIKRFGEEIINYFTGHELKVKAPATLESRHYGPLPHLPILRIGLQRRIRQKHEAMSKIFEEYTGSSYPTMELMLHIATGDVRKIRKEQVDYPGIDKKYFDSRVVEFNSVMGYDFEKLAGITVNCWAEACADEPGLTV